MKKILDNLYIIIFMLIIFMMPIISFIIPDKTFSEYENRELQLLPEFSWKAIFEASYQENINTYIEDQIVLRNEMVKSKNYLELLQGKLAVNDVYRAFDDFFIERHSRYDVELIQKNVQALNTFLEKYNAEAYLVPNANTMLADKIPFANDADINELLKDIPNITFVDEVLSKPDSTIVSSAQSVITYDLYYKTDHHWTTMAAYKLYKNIVENPVALNLEVVTDEFYGTIHNKLNIKMAPDTIYRQKSETIFEVYYDLGKDNLGLYFDKHLNTKDKYSYFLDSNHGLVQIRNMDIESNEKLLIIKDSYANCFVPFIAENYKEIDVIDLRYFNMPISAYMKTNSYDRIIVLYNKDGFATNTDVYKLGY